MKMPMYFEDSSSVTLLFSFWDVQGPAGMVLSVFIVLLLTVLYELLKVIKVWLSVRPLSNPHPASPPAEATGSSSTLTGSPSVSSLAPLDMQTTPANKWLWHTLQTFTHVVQVTLGYMLMLCVMSYNVWIFLGVIMGSVIGYFVAFPLIGQYA